MKSYNINKLLLTGGGTGGSVTPLLAIIDELRKKNKNFNYLWLGTKMGPERKMIEQENIRFISIIAGKWRRYFSFYNFIDLFKIKIAFWLSLFIMIKWRPNLIISAGSYVSVPVCWAGWILRIPVLIYQLDARPGLANKIMAPLAKRIAVVFKKSLNDYGKRAVLAGAMIRKEIKEIKIEKYSARQKLGLNSSKPVVFIIGGGTGAMAINKLVKESLEELTKFCQIFHITGKNKDISEEYNNYKPYEFVNTDGLIKMFSASDIVVSRCGMGVLSELSYLGKPSILIPIPDSHQEDNAQIFKENQTYGYRHFEFYPCGS